MYKIACLSMLLAFFQPPSWHFNMQEARQLAKKEHRHILLNFSGSDWCGPCVRLRKEILDQSVFLQMADTDLVLVNADFPRMKKNRLPADQQRLNDGMADEYNAAGKFPFTLLLDEDGKVIRQWEGFPNMTAEAFSLEVRNSIHGKIIE